MNRAVTFFIWPEVTVGLLTAAVFLFRARYNSYSDSDVRALERLLYLLPVLIVLAAFGGTYGSTSRTWLGLGRANVAAMVGLVICGYRVVSGFGAPGSGPKGQDAGFILLVTLGLGLCTIANAIIGSLVLRAQKPAVAEWYRDHGAAGATLTALSMVPILLVQIAAIMVIASVAGMMSGLFKR